MKDLAKRRNLRLDEKTATQFYGCFTAEPFERGYGYTIANSLRRILLSSLTGAAITSVKINGAMHEFAVLKGVKEDVAQIILNLKKVRVKLNQPATVAKIFLKAKGKGQVKAGDIEKNANVEIMNPEQEIANIDDGIVLDIEIEVSQGSGYEVADESKISKFPIGTILLDASFSPVKKVSYEVEPTRVENLINYDKLIFEIWTDGSISPTEALKESGLILKEALTIFIGDPVKEVIPYVEQEEEVTNSDQDDEDIVLNQSISVLELATRAINGLKKNTKVKTIRDLVAITEEEMKTYKSFGDKSIDEIKEKLSEIGLTLSGSAPIEEEDGGLK
jgi:DNA-directed RNA polymerase subunit alpha